MTHDGFTAGRQQRHTTHIYNKHTHTSLCQCEHHRNFMVCSDALIYPVRNTPGLKELLERATRPRPADKTPRTETRGLRTSRKLPAAEPIKHKTKFTHSKSCKAGQTRLFCSDRHSQEKPQDTPSPVTSLRQLLISLPVSASPPKGGEHHIWSSCSVPV